MSDVRFNFYPGVRNDAPAVSTIFQPTKQCGAIVASQSEVVVRKPRRSSGEREETKNGDVGRLRNSANPFENKPTSHFQLLDDFVRTICKHKKRNRVESPIETHCSRKDERRKSRRGRGHYQRATRISLARILRSVNCCKLKAKESEKLSTHLKWGDRIRFAFFKANVALLFLKSALDKVADDLCIRAERLPNMTHPESVRNYRREESIRIVCFSQLETRRKEMLFTFTGKNLVHMASVGITIV